MGIAISTHVYVNTWKLAKMIQQLNLSGKISGDFFSLYTLETFKFSKWASIHFITTRK